MLHTITLSVMMEHSSCHSPTVIHEIIAMCIPACVVRIPYHTYRRMWSIHFLLYSEMDIQSRHSRYCYTNIINNQDSLCCNAMTILLSTDRHWMVGERERMLAQGEVIW
jgi:hypothetical protein